MFMDASQSLRGKTKRQAQHMMGLVEMGAFVQIVQKSGGGQQHSKTMKVGKFLVLGSTNWTNNSRRNFEMSALIELDEKGERRYERMIDTMNLQSRRFTAADLQAAKSYTRITAFPRARYIYIYICIYNI